MADLLDHPQVASFLAKVDAVTRCAVTAPLVPDEVVQGFCGKEMPCPDHGAAILASLGFSQEVPSV